jgi:N-acetylglucosamine-6-phosphate deacetylase
MQGFLDLQINGCWGVDFNHAELSESDWLVACRRLYDCHTVEFLPTIITDGFDSLKIKLHRLARLCEQPSSDTAQPVGIHLEGPFISSELGFIGAHPKQHAIPATVEAMKNLLDAANGQIKMVTLAPEMDKKAKVTRFLSDQSILVAAGHTNATRDQLVEAIDNGLRCFTHFGNGCPPVLPRHDNILHRVMSLRDKIHVTLIADGFHLPIWMLKMSLDWFGDDRSIIVSDAISAAGLSSGFHTLGDRRVWVDEDGVPRSEDRSHFVGSGATMDKMHSIVSLLADYHPDQLEKLFRTNARRLLQG